MVKKKIQSWTSPFSISPFQNIDDWDNLPILKKDISLICLMISGIAVIGLAVQVIVGFDPYSRHYWVNKTDTLYFVGWLLTLLASSRIAYKQWNYYYKSAKGGQKYGIFEEKVRQVNNREETIDIILALNAGFLIAFSLTPIFWFFVLSLYCIFGCTRCFISLRRVKYANIIKNKDHEEVPLWYIAGIKKFYQKHRGLEVRYVLAGWVFSLGILSIISILSFIIILCLSSHQSLLFIFVIHIILLSINLWMWLGLSTFSYKTGKILITMGYFSYK